MFFDVAEVLTIYCFKKSTNFSERPDPKPRTNDWSFKSGQTVQNQEDLQLLDLKKRQIFPTQ